MSRSLLGHRAGVCPALVWDEDDCRYFCGLMVAPAQYLKLLPRALTPLVKRLAHRWIAAGSGCDCAIELE